MRGRERGRVEGGREGRGREEGQRERRRVEGERKGRGREGGRVNIRESRKETN